MKSPLVLGTLALVAGLLGLTETATPEAKPLKLRIGVHASIMGAPDVIAIRQGFFKQAGLDVEYRKFFLGKEGRDAMIAGAIDEIGRASCREGVKMSGGAVSGRQDK